MAVTSADSSARGSDTPAKVGATRRLHIERLVAGGDGMARDADGRVVFVEGVVAGEQVDAEFVEVKRDFARARLIAVVAPSASRVLAPCRHVADGCGGCDWQHLAAPAQHDAKVEIVREAFSRTGRMPDADIRKGASVGHDASRTTVRMAVTSDGRLGFRRAASHDVVGIESCLVMHPRLADLVNSVGVRGSGEVTLRCGDATGDRGIWAHDKARLLGLPDDVATGAQAVVHEEVNGVRLRVSMESFFQASRQAAESLVDAVARASQGALDGADGPVIDAYGGVGLFAATVVPVGVQTVLVESSESACADAQVNLRGHTAKVEHARFEHWKPQRAGLVIADPARSGLGKPGVGVIVETDAPRVVLVSCDAVAAARDARLLVDAGYQLVDVEVLDLFPHTHHVEVVARYERS
ncbi:MAG: class I SAM-dependent RNA methyltransferase [Actinomycetota bacterium]